MAAPDGSIDYAHLDEMDWAMFQAIGFLEEARRAEDEEKMEFHLKLASRAMRCALEMHIIWLQQQEDKHDVVSSDND